MDLPQPQEADSFVVIDETLPIESIGEDLSLEEAIVRLREITRQNEDLRKTVDSNSKVMKNQIQVLQEWKSGWEADRADVKEKHEQARQTVADLRADIAKKDAKIEQLGHKIKEAESLKSATPATVEQQELVTLQQRVVSLQKQVDDLQEDNNRLASAKDEVCREVDQHTKIVSELQVEKANLAEENRNLQHQNDTLTQEIKSLMEKAERFNVEKQELIEQNEKLRDYMTVGGAQEVVADAPEPTPSRAKAHNQGDMDKNMAELTAQLQDLRTENSELKQSNQQRMQEMHAMHRKMDLEAERLVLMEHEHRQTVNRLESDHQREKEQLLAELNKLRAQQSPRTSFDGSVASVEEMKALKTQVISLGNELDSANEKLRAMEELRGQQKDRVQAMEAKLKGQLDEAEQDRGKADELITKLQQSISALEAALANERHDNNAKTTALAENRKKFAQLLNDYHDSMTQTDELKRQLEQAKSGGGHHQAQIDNLLAQVMAADESMAHKAEEINRLKRERDEAFTEYDKVTQLLPVLKAQCDIYKKDFNAEREAREKIHREKEALKEENEQLHAEKMRLEEEMSQLSAVQLRMLRDRHGFNPSEAHRQEPGGGNTGEVPYMNAPVHQAPVPQQRLECPICHGNFPDTDTLQLHVNDCLNESAAN